MRLLLQLSNWKIILSAFFALVAITAGFIHFQGELDSIAGEAVPILDMRPTYSYDEVKTDFDKLGSEGIELYQFVTGKLDMVYPFAYTIFFIGLLSLLLRKLLGDQSKWLYAAYFPIVVMIFDYIENFTSLKLLRTHPNYTAEQVQFCEQITQIKAILVNVTMMMILVLGVVLLVKILRGRIRKSNP